MISSELLEEGFRFADVEGVVAKNFVKVPGLDIGAQTQFIIKFSADLRTSAES